MVLESQRKKFAKFVADIYGDHMATLYSWIGTRDREKILERKPNESPLGKMLLNRDCDRVVLISDYRETGSQNIEE